MADKENIVELPVGKLVGTLKTVKEEDGSTSKVMNFKGSTGDLHAWEQREHGIDDNIRASLAARNDALELMVSDFATEQFAQHPELKSVEVDLGMGNGAENFEVIGRKVSFFPQKKEDGTVERAEKVTYGPMKHTTRRIISKEVRLHHEGNQSKIEASITKAMNKSALK